MRNECYMAHLDEEDYKILVEILHSGILQCNLWRMFDFVKDIQNECCKPQEDIVESIFRQYIREGNFYNIKIKYKKKNSDIRDIIVYRQSKNYNINIIAKMMYRKYGKEKADFLDWQITKLLHEKEIDMANEYKMYLLSIGHSESDCDYLLSKNIFNRNGD